MASSRKIVAGNWKMHKTGQEAVEFLQQLQSLTAPPKGISVWVFPSYPALESVSRVASWVQIGAQNMHQADSGAYTGEVSAPQLKACGVKGVILGHSERRRYFAEADDIIRKKFLQAKKWGLFPILCVGEEESIRNQGEEKSWVKKQLIALLSSEEGDEFAIAYEPVWAIGTGKNATPSQAQEMHHHIRTTLRELGLPSEKIPILYGGSVTPENSQELLQEQDVDGLLIGGASLDLKKFLNILAIAEKVFSGKAKEKE